MTFNKKSLVALLIVTFLLVSPNITHASLLGDFFRSIFGIDKVENTQPAQSIGASIDDSTVKTTDTADDTVPPEDLDSISLPPAKDSPIKIQPPVVSDDMIRETEAILKYGMKNSTNTQTVQTRLKVLKYLDGVADGDYGKITVSAVANFQKGNNISGDGMIVGPVTVKALGVTLLFPDKPIEKINANNVSSTCTVNSFTVPTSTTIASGLSTTVSWSSDCDSVVLRADSGSYNSSYAGGPSGTYTFSAPSSTHFSSTDNSVDITLIAGNSTDTQSKTKPIPITDVVNPAFNQCAFINLTATPNPVPIGSNQTTLSWTAFPGCIVYLYSYTPSASGLILASILKPITGYFNSTDTANVTLSKSTTYYLTAQAETNPAMDGTTVLSARTIDVKMEVQNKKVLLLGGRAETVSRNDVFSSDDTDMENWNLISPNGAPNMWSPRMNADTVYFKNKYWVVGTSLWNSPINNMSSPHDIWSSPDGITWTLINPNPPFDNYYAPFISDFVGYFEYRATVLGDKIYVIGGKPDNNNHAVVWSSPDGINWTVETASAPFENRVLFSLVTHNGVMYVIGGCYDMNSNGNTGVWSSSDGVNWTQLNSNPPFTIYLADAKAISYNNTIYLLGGSFQSVTNGYSSKDVWSSPDGITWTKISSNLPSIPAGFTGFSARDVVVANNKLWLSNTAFGNVSNIMWSSTDAINWTQSTITPSWSARYSYRFIPNN
jgi:peptidoglycan hydrolase-like protein with peptidoglycan-binding domain